MKLSLEVIDLARVLFIDQFQVVRALQVLFLQRYESLDEYVVALDVRREVGAKDVEGFICNGIHVNLG